VRGLVQRVGRAEVTVTDGGRTVVTGAIGPGLCVLVGVTHDDDEADAARLAERIWHLRVLADDEGRMNRSLADRAAAGEPAEVLVVSQFTLYGDTRKGRRPSYVAAARPEVAEPLVDEMARRLEALGAVVGTGRFGADMDLSLVNDGPVTVLLEV
jgi:D-aminoacyl-tRNA deacylase